jgi:hypothetical protein
MGAMASADKVVHQIERNLARMGGYAQWRIGSTDRPAGLESQRHNPPFLRKWLVDSDEGAAEVVEHFVEHGMQRDAEHGKPGPWVYLY